MDLMKGSLLTHIYLDENTVRVSNPSVLSKSKKKSKVEKEMRRKKLKEN